MSFFQNAVLNKYLLSIDESQVDGAWDDFCKHFKNSEIQENIRNSKEEEYQAGFLTDLFEKVLGYSLYPAKNYNLRLEQKDEKGSKKADAALLRNGKVVGVIELKGTDTTDLDKVESQAFGYKNYHRQAEYVIISNFEKLRFYIDNAVEHLEFNLFELTKNEFKILWLCLEQSNFQNGIPKKIKLASLTENEQVTKKLYADYSAFKQDIFDSVIKHNPGYDKLRLFKKTQKLLDRFLFIFFAEDQQLLPPNSIKEVIKQWQQLKELDEYRPLYERFVKYFGYLNTGHKGKNHEIFPYNGGLFAPDEVLDSITIEDELLYKHAIKLSKYDFASEVDVNILGHIFEHSLNEIEEITAELEGQEVDRSKTRRKKDGVFYTPKYITKYIVENTVGKLCEEKKSALAIDDEEYRPNRQKKTKKELLERLEDYRKWLLGITICDPACGSGAFLNQALEFLMDEHHFVDELQAKLLNESIVYPDIQSQILENNLFGVDINEESVEIAKLSLWLRTAQKGRKLTSLNNNIKCGNSLIDDPEVAGEKAFKWEEEFPTVFEKKEKKAFHVTWVTHNSRTSQRMIDYKVKKGEPFQLDEKSEVFITKEIANIVKEDKLNVIAYNICEDHVHILLVCDPTELPNIVRKLKGRTSQRLKAYLEAPKDEVFHLWAQKFDRRPIEDYEELKAVRSYIIRNRERHNLPVNKGLQKLDKGYPDKKIPITNKGLQELDNGYGDEKSSTATVTANKGLQGAGKGYRDENNPTGNTTDNKGLQPLVIGRGGDDDYDSISKRSERGEFGYLGMCCNLDYAFRPEYSGGFDVVIGNPPYGAKLSKPVQKYLNKTFIKGGSETAISFIKLSYELIKERGALSFIIPKSFCFASNYGKIREFILNDIQEIVDCGKVWSDVKLEQIVFSVIKESDTKAYDSSLRINNEITKIGVIDKESFSKYGFFLNGISGQEKLIGDKIWSRKFRLNDVAENSRGGNFQKNITDEGDFPVLGGAEIQRTGVVGNKGMINAEFVNDNSKAIIQPNSVLVQNIVAHIKNPVDHIKITACLPDSYHYKIVDTINQITVNKVFDFRIIWWLLNSNLINWYVYRFIFGKAIRTMHFDNVVTERIPIPELDDEVQSELIEPIKLKIDYERSLEKIRINFINLFLAKLSIRKISQKLQNWHELTFKQFLAELKKKKVTLSLKEEAEWMEYFNEQKAKADELKSQIAQTDREIDAMVYELYGLTDDEIRIVEESTK